MRFGKEKRRFCIAKNSVVGFLWCHTEKTPAVPGPPTCNSSASRRGSSRSPVCRLPSQAHAQWLTFVTQLSLFRCILALTVPFAVGFDPFPFRLPPDQTWRFAAGSRTTSPDPIHLTVVVYHQKAPLVNDIRRKRSDQRGVSRLLPAHTPTPAASASPLPLIYTDPAASAGPLPLIYTDPRGVSRESPCQ